MATTTVLFAGPTGSLGTCGDVFFSVMRLPPTHAYLAEVRAAARSHHKRYGVANRGLSLLEHTALTADTPGDVREEASKIAKEFPAETTAVIVEGTGFAVAASRVIIAGMHLVRSGAKQRYKVTATTHEAVRWMLSVPPPSGGVSLDERALLTALEQVRNSIPSASASAKG